MVLAIDFDGTIHDWNNPKPGMRMGPPIFGAQEALRSFKEAGHTIVIFSVRGGEDSRKHVADWLNYYAIPYSYITNIKIPADWYIDDRGMHFTNWKEAVLRVATNNPEARRDEGSNGKLVGVCGGCENHHDERDTETRRCVCHGKGLCARGCTDAPKPAETTG